MISKRLLKKRERGFTILVYTLMIFVVFAFTGLAVDAGYLQWQRRLMQSAADAAAMGALREMELGRTNTQPQYDLTVAAQNDAALNGFSNGVNNISVTLNNPPVSGPFQGASTAAQVIITRSYPTFFMRVLGTNSINVSAQSVAQTSTSYGSIGGCIFALDATASDALNLESGTTLYSSCSAISESSATEAFKMAGSDTWNMTSHNAHIAVVGGATMSGAATIMDTTMSPAVSEQPVTGYTSPGDPLRNINAPTPSTVTGGVQSTSPASYNKNGMPAGNTLSPGIYCGGISVGNTGSNTLVFSAGTYVLAGGGLSLGSQATVSGTGVTFYSTSSSSAAWGCTNSYSAGVLSLTGQATSNFSAPLSGPMVGMLFFQDRALDPGTSSILGGSTSTWDGAIYLKLSNLKFAGNNSTTGYMVIVADTIDIHGGTTLGNNYTTLSDPNPFAPGSTGGGLVY
jgi:hypothetical protein